jgi:hypothetical protein
LLPVPLAGGSKGTAAATLAALAFLGEGSLGAGKFLGCLACIAGDASLAAVVLVNNGSCPVRESKICLRPRRVAPPWRVELGPKARVRWPTSVD